MTKVVIQWRKNISYPAEEAAFCLSSCEDGMPSNDKSFNCIMSLLKDSFALMELDKERIGTESWNPLQDNIIKPGDTVLIKPNMVSDRIGSENGADCLYTHPSLVSAVIPYVWKALEGKGKIIVADAPVQSCDFEKLINQSGYKRMVEHYQALGINIVLKDLRGLISSRVKGILRSTEVAQEGILVDLQEHSEHAKLNAGELKRVRITNYDPRELLKHHNEVKHEYLIAKDALDADVIINMPKPKAHRKAGVTLAMKNFVGVNVRKEYLPHHRFGDIQHGGDEYLKHSKLLELSSKRDDSANCQIEQKQYFRAKLKKYLATICSGVDKRLLSKEVVREGSWYGNDTIWRTIVDINRIIMYADKKGIMQYEPQRKIFTIADMIVVGEKEGPLLPSPKYAGIIAMSDSVVCFDEAVASILGFDVKKIPLYTHVRNDHVYPLEREDNHAAIVSNCEQWDQKRIWEINKDNAINIEPSSGWRGHIELD